MRHVPRAIRTEIRRVVTACTLDGLVRRAVCTMVCWAIVAVPRAHAQTWLPLDSVFAPAERVGCESLRLLDSSATNSTAARAAWREAQDALLEGNRARARTRLEASVAADARDARSWLDLGAVVEQLGDTTAAREAACRVLTLPSTTTSQRDEAQRRWQRLLSADMASQSLRAIRRHEEGVRLAQQADWHAARSAFDDVVRLTPSAHSAWRNRAIVAAEAGDLTSARRDLEHYVQAGSQPAERVLLARALNVLQRPRYRVSTTMVAGLIPGGAQLATGRPALAALILTAAVGGGVLAVTPTDRERLVPFLDPNGNPAPYRERYREYPYRVAGMGVATAVLLGGLVEGGLYASRSGRLPRLVASGTGVGLRVVWGGDRRHGRGRDLR